MQYYARHLVTPPFPEWKHDPTLIEVVIHKTLNLKDLSHINVLTHVKHSVKATLTSKNKKKCENVRYCYFNK